MRLGENTNEREASLSQESRLKQQEQELALLLQQLGEVQENSHRQRKKQNHPTHQSRRQPTRLMFQSHIRKKSGRKRGKPGHQGQRRLLYELKDISVTDCYPTQCRCCGELSGQDLQSVTK